MAKIVTVYNTERRITEIGDMSYIRWFRMSEELAKLGHEVDMATGEQRWRPRKLDVRMAPRLRRIPISRVRWDAYDVVQAHYQQGFETLRRFGGAGHAYIIARLGSVVADEDRPGIPFHGHVRQQLFDTQREIARACRYVAVLTPAAEVLWRQMHGERNELLLVPGAVDSEIPPPGPDPFPPHDGRRCLFAGSLRGRRSQPEANRVFVTKLNELGRLLAARGAKLYVLGEGRASDLDDEHVHYLGAVPYGDSWAYLQHADVGIVISTGEFCHNNESTKVYHYLRAGLPIVAEAGLPNDDVTRASGNGVVVDAGDLEAMAEAAVRPIGDAEVGIDYVLGEHTWARRARVYHDILVEQFGAVA